MAEGISTTVYTLNPYLEGDLYLYNPIDVRDLPNSVCEVPIVWNNLFSKNPDGQEQQLTLYAGFTGAFQYKNRALQPNCGWYITRSDSFDIAGYEVDYLSAGKYREDWSEVASDERVTIGNDANVIYNPQKFKMKQESLEALKKELIQHMKKQFPNETVSGTHISFTVSHRRPHSDNSPG